MPLNFFPSNFYFNFHISTHNSNLYLNLSDHLRIGLFNVDVSLRLNSYFNWSDISNKEVGSQIKEKLFNWHLTL